MATYTIIAGGLRKGNNGRFLESPSEFYSIVFDSVEEISFNYSSRPSSHPIDSNANITDHVFNENDKFTISGHVTNTPINIFQNNVIEYGAAGSLTRRWEQAHNKFKEIKENSELLILATPFRTAENCILTSVSGSVTPEKQDHMVFDLSFEKVRLVEAETIILPANIASSLKAKTQSKKAGGSKDKDVEAGTAKAKEIEDICADAEWWRKNRIKVLQSGDFAGSVGYGIGDQDLSKAQKSNRDCVKASFETKL